MYFLSGSEAVLLLTTFFTFQRKRKQPVIFQHSKEWSLSIYCILVFLSGRAKFKFLLKLEYIKLSYRLVIICFHTIFIFLNTFYIYSFGMWPQGGQNVTTYKTFFYHSIFVTVQLPKVQKQFNFAVNTEKKSSNFNFKIQSREHTISKTLSIYFRTVNLNKSRIKN